MAFEKMECNVRPTISFPALHVNKGGTCVMNSAFIRMLNIQVEEGKTPCINFDIFFDKDTNQLGFKIHKDGEFRKAVNKNNQVQFYIRSRLKSIGCDCNGIFKLEYIEKYDMYVCQLKKSEKKDNVVTQSVIKPKIGGAINPSITSSKVGEKTIVKKKKIIRHDDEE